jgi:hypothetical protein
MWKECNVVMLPTRSKAQIAKRIKDNNLHFFSITSDDFFESQHLYITSNEVPKANDWCINKNKDTVYQINGLGDVSAWNKIIAATDTLDSPSIVYPTVFQISQSFIKQFIIECNKGNVITKVMVDFVLDSYEENGKSYHYSDGRLKLRLNQSNEVTIQTIKDSWSREEVIILLHQLSGEMYKRDVIFSPISTNKWIEENL